MLPSNKINMTFEEFKKTEWYISRPDIIKQAMEILPPTQLYKFKSSGKQCYIRSYEGNDDSKIEDVTVTVKKTGVGGLLAEFGMGALDTNGVFGIKLTDLEPWTEK
jgi:hypothetical protein